MATSFLSRKPDSGLGNIGASPGDPSRNIDWVLMSAQAALTVLGMFVDLLGIAHAHRRRPVRVRHPAGRLRDHRGGRHVDRHVVRLRMVEAARRLPLRAHARAPHLAVPARRGVGRGQDLLRLGAAQPAAGRDGEVHHVADARVVPRRGAQRRGVVRPVPRRTDDRRRAGRARHHPAGPRLGVGDRLDRDGGAARRRSEGALHRADHVPVDRHRSGGVRRATW